MIAGQPEPAEACTDIGAEQSAPKSVGVLTWCALAVGFVIFFAVGSVLVMLPLPRRRPTQCTFSDYTLLRRLQMGPLAAMRMARRMSKPVTKG